MNKLGLVLEGGGNRGIYTAGVLDTFLEENITVDGVIGVSAGSIHGASFISGQKGRSINYTKKYCRDPRYMSFKSWRKTGNYVGVDFCYHELPEKLFPFDNDTFENSPMKFYDGNGCPKRRGSVSLLPVFARRKNRVGQSLGVITDNLGNGGDRRS